MSQRIFAVCGIVAPVLYPLIIVIGATLKPDYSHVSHTISELIQSGAPNKTVLDVALTVYNLLIIAFAVGLYRSIDGRRWARIGVSLLVASAVLEILMIALFPTDPVGSQATFTGGMHYVLVLLLSLSGMAAVAIMGFGFGKDIRRAG